MPVDDDFTWDEKDRARLELVLEAAQRVPQIMRATGASMAPHIPSGSLLELAALEGPARPGDVVAAFVGDASIGEEFVIHRVVGIDARGRVLLKPDGLPWVDGWTAPEQVRARVVRVNIDGVWQAPVRGGTTLEPYRRLSLVRLVARRLRERFSRRFG